MQSEAGDVDEVSEEEVARMSRVRIDGKQFALGDQRFPFRGVTYGTFQPRPADGARFPEREQIKLDLADMAENGFTVIRTYTEPTDDVLNLAADWDIRVFAGVHYADWRYLVGGSRRQRWQLVREAKAEIRAAARRLAGRDEVLAVCLGNEIPADVIRWIGHEEIARALQEMADLVREEDDEHLVTYGNYPSAEYLPLDDMDFLTFNVFLETEPEFRRYLTRLQHLAGDRPLVIGELGGHAEAGRRGERAQAEMLDWQLKTVIERGAAGACVFSWTDDWWVGDAPVEGWHFGLTRQDRSPRRSMAVAEKWNSRTVADIEFDWPAISVVICAYNAGDTIDECLTHACALDYPDVEILVIDDGSTDATADLARRHPRAKVVTIEHAGLSAARNEGMRLARGSVIAYLDSDAYPSPEWLHYLALGLDGPTVGGVGGPNVPPRDDPPGAQRVARAPGGPVHVLMADDRAEHVPGCNMAFWKIVLNEVGGFDPIYTAAGDDVDLCWKVLDRGWDIGFHPAALVWHHRRSGVRTYLKQQRGYGRAEALVEARHPDRFTPTGSARWRGHIYNSSVPSSGKQRIYRGEYGVAAYQSAYRAGGHGLELAHQLGVPLAVWALLFAPLAVLWPVLTVVPVLGLAALLALAVVDARAATPPRGDRGSKVSFRAGVAALHLLQPLARTWGRVRHRRVARRDLPPGAAVPGPAVSLVGGVQLLPDVWSRSEVAAAIVAGLRSAGLVVVPATGWEDHDATILGSFLVRGHVVTSSHPVGSVQVRVRRRLRPFSTTLGATVVALLGTLVPVIGLAGVAAMVADLAIGVWRTGPLARRRIRRLAGDLAPG